MKGESLDVKVRKLVSPGVEERSKKGPGVSSEGKPLLSRELGLKVRVHPKALRGPRTQMVGLMSLPGGRVKSQKKVVRHPSFYQLETVRHVRLE